MSGFLEKGERLSQGGLALQGFCRGGRDAESDLLLIGWLVRSSVVHFDGCLWPELVTWCQVTQLSVVLCLCGSRFCLYGLRFCLCGFIAVVVCGAYVALRLWPR